MWVLDLDGVVWLANTPITKSPEAIHELRARGEHLRFVTNNSVLTVAKYLDKFKGMGIEVQAHELITSAMAAASLLQGGEEVYVLGQAGLLEQVEKVATVVRDGDEIDQRTIRCDAVVLGWDGSFTYDKLRRAMVMIEAGARFIATNADPTYPTPQGLIPGAGSILAALECATRQNATVAGKPNPAIVELTRASLDGESVMVGDRYSTDGVFAHALGIPFYLIESDVAEEIPEGSQPPDRQSPSLWDLVTNAAVEEGTDSEQ
jgi:4-nitrophenyl phosphatase